MRLLVLAASLVVVVAGLKVAAPILVPVALSIFLAITLMPAVAWLRKHRVPNIIAILGVVLTTFVVLGGILSIAAQSLSQIRLAFPRYQAQFLTMLDSATAVLAQRGITLPTLLDPAWIGPERVMDFASGALVGLAGFMSSVVLVLLLTIFTLIEMNGLPAKIRLALGRPDLNLSRFIKIADEVQRYLAMKTVISLVTGLLIGVWSWVLGMDFPVFWGLFAFLLNYVPNVGSILVVVPQSLLALVQLGPKGVLLLVLGHLVVHTILGNAIEPHVMGRRLGLSELVVLLSLVFWGWIWGPVGMLLSVPLTMIVRIMLENTQQYRWLAVLLGPPPHAALPEQSAAPAPAPAAPPESV
jgi:predicted PurR-regulated permease PerM